MQNVKAFERREYQQVKADLHRKILDRLDLEKLGRTPSAAAREEVLLVIRNTVNSEAVPLSFADGERAPGGWLACECDHSSPGDRRAGAVNSALWARPHYRTQHDREPDAHR